MTKTHQFIAVLVTILCVTAVVVLLIVWGIGNMHDDHIRNDIRIHACTTIEDPAVRALCIAK